MRVYFAAVGIGLGHVGRVLPIARKLAEKNAKVLFSTYSDGVPYVEKEHFQVTKAPPLRFRARPDGGVDFKQSMVNPGPFLSILTLLRQVNSEIRSIGSFRPNVVVSDSRISTLLAALLLRIPRVLILNQFQVIIPRRRRLLRLAKLADSGTLTLLGKIWTCRNTVLIPDFPEPFTVSAGNLMIPRSYKKNITFTGPILPVRPEMLPTKEQMRRKLKLSADRPLIFVPISGQPSEKRPLIEILMRILPALPNDYQVIMSLGSPNGDDVVFSDERLTVYEWIPNRFDYLKACDLVISRAGHGTITQCMCYGKPMILIPTPNHTEQLINARKTADLGAARILLQDRLSAENLMQNIKEVLTNTSLERVSQIQYEVLKHDGLESVVKIIDGTARR